MFSSWILRNFKPCCFSLDLQGQDMSRLFVCIFLVTVRFELVTSNILLKCKAREGCHFTGCDPAPYSTSNLARNEFPITCQGNSTESRNKESDEFLMMLIELDKKRAERE